MGRAEYRRQKREQSKSSKIYNMTPIQIRNLKDQATDKAVNKAFVLMLGFPLIVLHDKFGYGKKRLERFIDELLKQYEAFDEGRITLDDLMETIEAETGVKVKEIN